MDRFITHQSAKDVIQVSEIIYTFAGDIQDDLLRQLSIPFFIDLPLDLPSSFLLYLSNNSRMTIRYKIKVRLE
jgi:hypothetical protein